MHIAGMGDIEKLATGIGKIFQTIKQISAVKVSAPHTPLAASKTSLDPKAIETTIGASVEKAGDIYKVTIGRTTGTAGHDAGKMMGVNTWAAFAGSYKRGCGWGLCHAGVRITRRIKSLAQCRHFHCRNSSPLNLRQSLIVYSGLL